MIVTETPLHDAWRWTTTEELNRSYGSQKVMLRFVTINVKFQILQIGWIMQKWEQLFPTVQSYARKEDRRRNSFRSSVCYSEHYIEHCNSFAVSCAIQMLRRKPKNSHTHEHLDSPVDCRGASRRGDCSGHSPFPAPWEYYPYSHMIYTWLHLRVFDWTLQI